MNNSKDNYRIFVCGMTQNDRKNIDELTSQYQDYVDGHIWVDHGSTDGTKEILEEREGVGHVIDAKFYKYHCQSMNLFLFDKGLDNERGLKIGDFFILRDGQERFNDNFIKNIRQFCDNLAKDNINTVFSHGKPFIARYFDDMHFIQSPHYSLQNFRMNVIDLKNYFEKEEEYAYRLWDGQEGGRPFDNKINHEIKYLYEYGISNHAALGLTSQEEFVEREGNRVKFRYYCRDKYNLEFTKESLLNFLLTDGWKNDNVFINMIEKEKVFKNFYRYRVLSHDFYDIEKTENEWSLIEYLKHE